MGQVQLPGRKNKTKKSRLEKKRRIERQRRRREEGNIQGQRPVTQSPSLPQSKKERKTYRMKKSKKHRDKI